MVDFVENCFDFAENQNYHVGQIHEGQIVMDSVDIRFVVEMTF